MPIYLLDRSVRILDYAGDLITAANPFPVTATFGGTVTENSQTQVRNSADSAWVNVGVGAESATVLHMPVRIQGTGANVIEPLNSTPVGTEYALPVRSIGSSTITVGQADKSTFTEGSTSFVPIGGEFKDSGTDPADGQAAVTKITGKRALHVNLRDNSGVEVDPRLIRSLTNTDVVTAEQGTSPWVVSGSVTTSGTVAVTQSTSPWVIGDGGGSITVDGTIAVTQSTSPWIVDGSGVTQPVSGTVTANQGGAPWSVVGTLTHNNAAPGANNIGVLPAIANADAPTYTEGDQVLLSVDLAGAIRTSGGSSGDTISISGIESQAVFDNRNRKLLEEILLKIEELRIIASDPPVPSNTARPVTSRFAYVQTSIVAGTVLLSSNPSRIGATVYNDSGKRLDLALFDNATVTTLTIELAPAGFYEVPFGYTGIITGVWDGAEAVPRGARITEFIQ